MVESAHITHDINVIAHWTINVYTVTFDPDNGETTMTRNVVYNNTIDNIPENPEKTGYTFAGWYDENGDEFVVDEYTRIIRNENLTAHWNINTYTVTFETDYGTSVAEQRIDYNNYIDQTAISTSKTGYHVEGWYRDAEFTQLFDFDTMTVVENLTLYAHWVINQYTVSFETDGGSSVPNQTVEHGSLVARPTDPTKVGYNFINWYVDENYETVYEFGYGVVGDTVIYARFEIIKFTVKFDSRFADVIVSDQLVDYGSMITVPDTPVCDGFTFMGWYDIYDGSKSFDFNEKIYRNVDLFAKWRPNDFDDIAEPEIPNGDEIRNDNQAGASKNNAVGGIIAGLVICLGAAGSIAGVVIAKKRRKL